MLVVVLASLVFLRSVKFQIVAAVDLCEGE